MRVARKGQLQAMEPILIVVVLSMVLGLTLMFYLRVQSVDDARTQRQLVTEEDTATLLRITSLPEISCPQHQTAGAYCIDKLKATAFSNAVTAAADHDTNKIAYYPFFGATKITIQWIDLQTGSPSPELELYNAQSTPAPTKVKVTRSYFTVYDPSIETKQFAVMTISREVI